MEADMILLLREGRILERGSYGQLMAMKGEIAQLIKTSQNEDQSEDDSTRTSDSIMSDEDSTVYGGSPVVDDDEDQAEAEAAQEGGAHLAPLRVGGGNARKNSFQTLRRASTASFKGPRGKVADEEGGGLKSKQSKEFQEQGKVKWSVYGEYAKTSNLVAVSIYLLLLIGAQTSSIGMLHSLSASRAMPFVGHFLVIDANIMQALACGSNIGQRSTSGTAGTPKWANTSASTLRLVWDLPPWSSFRPSSCGSFAQSRYASA